MRAYIVASAGGPFIEKEMEQPTPAANQVLVRIVASGLNPLDLKIRAGQAEHAKQPLPAVLGLDMAGVVESVGAEVTTFSAGDEVFGMVGGVGGLQGTLADFVAADEALLSRKPSNLTMRQASVMPLVSITAYEGLVDKAKLHAQQTVLIHAGTGGVGYAAIQIALDLGAKVYTTVSQDKRSLVEALGAIAIDRYTPPEEYLKICTGGEGFDVVYDTVGGAVLDASFSTVKRYTGHVVSCLGWGSHLLAPLSFRSATYSGVFTLFPLLSGTGRSRQGAILAEVAALADRGRMRPQLSADIFDGDQIAAAYELAAFGKNGNVCVQL